MAAVEEFDPTKDSVATNAARLASHVLQKGFQAGGLVGLAVVAPILAYRNKGAPGLALRLARAQAINSLAFTALAGALGAARVMTAEGDMKEGLEDRAYRLHYNTGQNRTDKFAQVGIALGGTAAATALGPTPMVVVAGASAGAAFGVLAHVATMKSAAAAAAEEK